MSDDAPATSPTLLQSGGAGQPTPHTPSAPPADPGAHPAGGATPPAAADALPLVLDDGSFAPKWYERYEGLAQHGKSLRKFQSPEALAKSYKALEDLRTIPGPDATEEQINAYRQAAGIDPDDYPRQLKAPEQVPEGIEMSEDFVRETATWALSHNLTPDQANAMMAREAELAGRMQAQVEAASAQQYQADEAALKEYAQRQGKDVRDVTATALEVAGILGIATPEQVRGEAALDPRIGNNVPLIEALHRMYEAVSEDTLQGVGSKHGGSGLLDTAGSREKARELVHHPAWNDPSHPEHQDVHTKYERYMGAALAAGGRRG